MKNNLYIGNYGKNGIDIVKIDMKSIKKDKLCDDENTSYIIKDKNFLYSVIEIADPQTKSGYVIVYDLQNKKKVNIKMSYDADPCFLSIDPLRRILFICNYTRWFNCSI